MWTRRICSRPSLSGACTGTRRSKRPGRSKAESSTSGRFVAARTMTPVEASKPSISVRIWLSVCSRSSFGAAVRTRAARAADRVDLVDEDDRRSGCLRLREQVADAGGADADDHLDELGRGHREERDSGFAGDSARRAASCRCPGGRSAGRRAGCGRRACGTCPGRGGSRRPRPAPPWPRRSRRRRQR